MADGDPVAGAIMTGPPDPLPSSEQALLLHRRLVEADPTASADLAAAYLDHLIDWLASQNRKIAPEFCATAAEDAILALIKNPKSYDPSRQGLSAYLHLSAQGDLLNLLRREARHTRGKNWEAVEQAPDAGKYLARDDDPTLPLQIREEAAIARQEIVPQVREGLKDAESRVLDLLLKGERRTAVFAAAFGISHLPKEQQVLEIKRVKDMLKIRLKRARSRHGQSS
jgi:hypothetical protein